MNIDAEEGIRLNRYIARAGVSSRRKADELIEQGLVKVNNQTVTELGAKVHKGDKVEVNGREISPGEYVYILLNKPSDIITTRSDEKGRKTVLDLIDLPDEIKDSLFPVGRLDRNTVGVLLLTNDGDLAHRLMHPRYEVDKVYFVKTRDDINPGDLQDLKNGVVLEDGPAKADQADYLTPGVFNEIGVMLHEGRNRQVRRMIEHLGHEVTHLERLNYAGLTTKGVRRGKWRKLFPHEIRKLRSLVKL